MPPSSPFQITASAVNVCLPVCKYFWVVVQACMFYFLLSHVSFIRRKEKKSCRYYGTWCFFKPWAEDDPALLLNTGWKLRQSHDRTLTVSFHLWRLAKGLLFFIFLIHTKCEHCLCDMVFPSCVMSCLIDKTLKRILNLIRLRAGDARVVEHSAVFFSF